MLGLVVPLLVASAAGAAGRVNNFGEIVIEPGTLAVRLMGEDGSRLGSHTIGAE